MKQTDLFFQKLHAWYSRNKRVLPFRGIKDPYKIWVSEILLQQTQMKRGVEFYNRFIKRFPTIHSLSETTWNNFLPYFEGLGYYNRGRNMLKAAKVVMEQYKGKFPQMEKELISIPGIGPYTAKAILSFAYNKPVLPLDTNIKRILGRVFLGKNKLDEKTKEGKKLLDQIEIVYKKVSSVNSNQGMMDFGTAICLTTKPKCLECPLFKMCIYGQKEKPYLYEKKKVTREKYKKKYVVAEIYDNKRLIKYKGKLLGGYLEKGDERAFLKILALERMGLKISVRPVYRTWIKKNVKYSLHRCYILGTVKYMNKIHI